VQEVLKQFEEKALPKLNSWKRKGLVHVRSPPSSKEYVFKSMFRMTQMHRMFWWTMKAKISSL